MMAEDGWYAFLDGHVRATALLTGDDVVLQGPLLPRFTFLMAPMLSIEFGQEPAAGSMCRVVDADWALLTEAPIPGGAPLGPWPLPRTSSSSRCFGRET